MREQEVRNLWEAYLEVCEQETGRGPRISDTYDMRDAEGGPKGGGTIKIKGPKKKNVIRKEEVETWVNSLIEEGYDLSEYSWDDMYEMYIDEELTGERKKRALEKGYDVLARGREGSSVANTDDANLPTKRGGSGPRRRPKVRGGRTEYAYEADRGKGNKAAKRASEPNESFDLFDTILSHLIDEGYAETQEQAEVIMVNMSEDWRESIVEARMDPRGRPASGPMNVYANPKGKPDQAHLDAIKSYDEKQKKKTPEQRKAELDAYKERQLNNK